MSTKMHNRLIGAVVVALAAVAMYLVYVEGVQ